MKKVTQEYKQNFIKKILGQAEAKLKGKDYKGEPHSLFPVKDRDKIKQAIEKIDITVEKLGADRKKVEKAVMEEMGLDSLELNPMTPQEEILKLKTLLEETITEDPNSFNNVNSLSTLYIEGKWEIINHLEETDLNDKSIPFDLRFSFFERLVPEGVSSQGVGSLWKDYTYLELYLYPYGHSNNRSFRRVKPFDLVAMRKKAQELLDIAAKAKAERLKWDMQRKHRENQEEEFESELGLVELNNYSFSSEKGYVIGDFKVKASVDIRDHTVDLNINNVPVDLLKKLKATIEEHEAFKSNIDADSTISELEEAIN